MKQEFVVAAEEAGQRLDRYLAARIPELSRTRVQELIAAALVRVDGNAVKGSHKLRGGERVEIEAQPRPALRAEPEPIPLDVLYEDDDLLVVNKPAGMTVHAGAGGAAGTLVNALLGRGQPLSTGGSPLRPGIVHRLDRQTSGAIVVAKNDFAHARLAAAFQRRKVAKTYIALVEGSLPRKSGRIELAVGRDPRRRERMTARRDVAGQARPARTDWRALASFGGCTLVEVQLHTGRTHQARVHFAALRHPVVGDTLYGAAKQERVGKIALPELGRNFLHAARLSFQHPRSKQPVEVRAPLPGELRDYLRQLATAAGRDPADVDAALGAYL
ncbi:MAG TPA: RluA family pseudouridine synthase [Methylomirabilota bacterium]|nr:RluA family pseudouridine synthase [Methylomirabilota bacterium]